MSSECSTLNIDTPNYLNKKYINWIKIVWNKIQCLKPKNLYVYEHKTFLLVIIIWT